MPDSTSPDIIYVGEGDPNEGRIADSQVAHVHANYLQQKAVSKGKDLKEIADEFGEDEIEIARSALEERVDRDTLTGLYSRHFYEMAITRELSRSIRTGEALGLIVGDVKALKAVNDTWGHATGDKALAVIGNALLNQAYLRASDLVCRVGGDEIRAVVPGVKPKQDTNGHMTAKDGLVVVAFRMLDAVHQNQTEVAPGETIPLHLDCGVTLANDKDTDLTIFNRADKASYLAKRVLNIKDNAVVVASVGEDGIEVFEVARRSLDRKANVYTPIPNAREILSTIK